MASEQVFIDTSMFKALVDPKDEFYQKANDIWEKLKDQKLVLVTTNFILDETFTLIRMRCGRLLSLELRQRLEEGLRGIKIVRVLALDEKHAWPWFEQDWNGLSFTDCVSFAVMKRLGIDSVAAFDKHFARAGFEIVIPEMIK